MGFLDRLLGRENDEPTGAPPIRQAPAGAGQTGQQGGRSQERSADEIAVERYQYLLRTAPPETIEQVHTEAFQKLTPEQRDLLFQRLSENQNAHDRPADSSPENLARSATRTELQKPGTLQRAFGDGQGGQAGQGGRGGMGFGSMVGGSLLGTVAGYVIGSAIVSSFLPDPGADDASGADDADAADNTDNSDSAGAEGADAGSDPSADVASADSASADSSGDFGGDLGGGDFGGGDFGGGFDF